MLKHGTFMSAIVLVGAAVAATAGYARDSERGPGGMEMRFEELDADGNGEITLEEIETRMQSRFTDADADGDGMLTRDEMIAAAQVQVEERVDRMLKRADTDGDGALSMDEMPKPRGGWAERMFGRVDADDSGGISKEEFAQMREHRGRHGRDDKGDQD